MNEKETKNNTIQEKQGTPQWEGKTGGGAFGQSFLLRFLRSVNVRFLYPILYLVIPFYILFAGKGRNASYRYFRDRLGYSVWKSAWATFKNHIIFGEVVLDKFALLAGNSQQFKIHLDKNGAVAKQMSSDKGFIIAGAHVGNLELAGLCMPHTKKKINAIIFGGERANFQNKRDEAFNKTNINLIPVTEDMSHLFTIKEALERGEIVVIPCDRVFGSPKSIICDFIEGKARFPIGTFRLAAQLEVPILTLFIMKQKGTTYHVHERLLEENPNLSNSTKKAEDMAKQYVKELEDIVKKYPTQWFNFFPFWEA